MDSAGSYTCWPLRKRRRRSHALEAWAGIAADQRGPPPAPRSAPDELPPALGPVLEVKPKIEENQWAPLELVHLAQKANGIDFPALITCDQLPLKSFKLEQCHQEREEVTGRRCARIPERKSESFSPFGESRCASTRADAALERLPPGRNRKTVRAAFLHITIHLPLGHFIPGRISHGRPH